MTLDLRRTGEALEQVADELVRIWRAARRAETPRTFPALAEAAVAELYARVGAALSRGDDPGAVGAGVAPAVRVEARDREGSARALEAEWELAREVLVSACDALEGDPAAAEWLGRAVEAARTAPPAVTIWRLSGTASRDACQAGRGA